MGVGLKTIVRANIKPTTMNIIEEKVGNTFEHIGIGDHFLNISPVSQTLREKKLINKTSRI